MERCKTRTRFVTYDIELSRIALKNMAKIPKKDLVRIQDRIDALSIQPNPPDLKKVRGDENLFRIRSGDYRILYRIFNKVLKILIVDIDHRRDIYKNL